MVPTDRMDLSRTAPRPRFLLRLVLSCLLIVGFADCGADQPRSKINLKGNAIVWAGFADADPRLKTDLDATVACLQQHSLGIRSGCPYVVVVHGTIDCDGIEACGCTDMNGPTIYMDDAYLYTYAFSHEVVHWETGMGNEYHNTVQFDYCSQVESW